jgi:hypothetical protein
MAFIPKDIEPMAGDDAADAGFYSVSVKKNRNDLETFYELSLKNAGGESSSTINKTGQNRMIIESGVASDHAIMILDALERLGLVENK